MVYLLTMPDLILHRYLMPPCLKKICTLLGSAASLTDFAAYHPLWFTRTQTSAMADVLRAAPAVMGWMHSKAALGHGQAQPLIDSKTIAVSANGVWAKASLDACFQDDRSITPGHQVSSTPESFGAAPTVGKLICASCTRAVLRRFGAQGGMHFPRVGYALKQE